MDPAAPVDAAPMCLPTSGVVDSRFLEVTSAAAGIPFHMLLIRTEVLVVLHTVLMLRGWPEGCDVVADVVPNDALTEVRVVAVVAAAGAPCCIRIVDAEHGLTIVHRLQQHEDLTLITLEHVVVVFGCPSCEAPAAPGACHRCGLELVDALRQPAGVHLRIKNKNARRVHSR